MAYKRSLFSLKKFWLSITIPLLVSAIWATYIAGLWSDIPNNFWELVFEKLMNPDDALKGYKSPLAVAALAFPLVALVTSHHRSVQTAEQIKASERKENFENYYKHQECFFNFVENIKEGKLYSFEFESVTKLYHSIFFNNSVVLFDPYENSTNNLDRAYKIIVESDKYLPVEGDHHNKNELAFTQLKIASFVLKISSIEIELNGKKTKINFMDDYKFFDKETILLIRNSIAEFINNLIFFSSNEKSIFCEMFTKGYLYAKKVEG